jgi:hypothetical protein
VNSAIHQRKWFGRLAWLAGWHPHVLTPSPARNHYFTVCVRGVLQDGTAVLDLLMSKLHHCPTLGPPPPPPWQPTPGSGLGNAPLSPPVATALSPNMRHSESNFYWGQVHPVLWGIARTPCPASADRVPPPRRHAVV